VTARRVGDRPIQREAMPAGRIPRCCPEHRLATLDALTWLLAIDASSNVASMVDEGWAAADAVDATRRWLLELVGAAIDAGLTFGAAA
jgi:hypothetical protein